MPSSPNRPILLASRSLRRKKLLRRLVNRFACVPAPEPRPAGHGGGARRISRQMARFKAEWAARRHPRAIVIGADTLAARRANGHGPAIGQPRNRNEAKRILGAILGGPSRTVSVFTSICVIAPGRKRRLWTEKADLRFGPVSPPALRAYLRSGRWKGKAGGFDIGGKPALGWVAEIRGDPHAAIGLPLRRLARVLRPLRQVQR